MLGFILLIQACGYVTTGVSKNTETLECVAKNGQILINAIEQYKTENGEYPEEHDLLFPKYIKSKELLLYDFKYNRSDKSTNYPESETKSWGGYEITLFDLNQWVTLGGRDWHMFVYRPSEYYPERKWEKPKKRVGNWAHIVTYRRYGDKTNPVTGPGV